MAQKMNVKLLREVKAEILAEPRKFEMAVFAGGDKSYHYPKSDPPPCKTIACIGGWGILLHARKRGIIKRLTNISEGRFSKLLRKLWPYRNPLIEAEATAKRIFRLTTEQAGRLFHEINWPNQFVSRHDSDPVEKARLAAARIDHFIATNGRE